MWKLSHYPLSGSGGGGGTVNRRFQSAPFNVLAFKRYAAVPKRVLQVASVYTILRHCFVFNLETLAPYITPHLTYIIEPPLFLLLFLKLNEN